MNNNLYPLYSTSGNLITKFSEPRIKRMLSEDYRDIPRRRLKGTWVNWNKNYGHINWDQKNFNILKNAFFNTKTPSLDHNYCIDFWFHFCEGKYMQYCLHPSNIFVISKDRNTRKGNKVPCLDTNNQMTITIANDIGIHSDDLKNALHSFKTNKKKFIQQYKFENSVKNIGDFLLKEEIQNVSFDELM